MPTHKPQDLSLPGAAESLLSAVSSATKAGGMPPVHLWNPDFCGDIDMRIARDGTWFYLGTPIGRAPMVKLFSSILKREGEKYVLVTPVEKVGIVVDDLPLHAVDIEAEGQAKDQILTFTTKTEDAVLAGADHPIRVDIDAETGEPSPSILVRSDLWARIDRKSFLRMVDLGCHELQDGDSWFGLWSSGQFFPVIKSYELT